MAGFDPKSTLKRNGRRDFLWRKISSPTRASLLSFDRVVELAKIVALATAGCWTVWQYQTNQKQRDELEIVHAELEIEHSRLESDRSRLESQRLEQEIDREKAKQIGSFALSIRLVVNPHTLNQKNRTADVLYSFANKGDVAIKVGSVVIEWYVGGIEFDSKGNLLVRLSAPPCGPIHGMDLVDYPVEPRLSLSRRLLVVDDEEVRNHITWRRRAYYACQNISVGRPESLRGYQMASGGCGVDTYQPGVAADYTDEVALLPPLPKVVGVSIYVLYGPKGSERYAFQGASQLIER